MHGKATAPIVGMGGSGKSKRTASSAPALVEVSVSRQRDGVEWNVW